VRKISDSAGRLVEEEGYSKLILLDGRDLRQPGTLIQVVVFPPGGGVKPHHHEKQVEFFLVLEGTAELTIAGKTFNASAGDMFLCEPGDVHSLINNSGREFRMLVFKTNYPKEPDFVWD
jgi:quercetin dioxygenase-like cupin family protein